MEAKMELLSMVKNGWSNILKIYPTYVEKPPHILLLRYQNISVAIYTKHYLPYFLWIIKTLK